MVYLAAAIQTDDESQSRSAGPPIKLSASVTKRCAHSNAFISNAPRRIDLLDLGPARRFLLRGNFARNSDPLGYIIEKMPKSLLRVSSLWFVITLIVLMALEVPSATGRILERIGADIVAGWLGQLVFLSLFVDALKGTLPRAVMIIPIIFYSSYYFAFWEQGIHVKLESDQLRRTNPGTDRRIQFDTAFIGHRSGGRVCRDALYSCCLRARPILYPRRIFILSADFERRD